MTEMYGNNVLIHALVWYTGIYLYTTSAKFIPIAFNFPLKDSKNKLDIMILIIVWALIFNNDRQYTALYVHKPLK